MTCFRGGNVESKPVVGYYGLWVALTYLSVVVAILGIHFALTENVRYALVCLMISGVCDMFDGRVASLFRNATPARSTTGYR